MCAASVHMILRDNSSDEYTCLTECYVIHEFLVKTSIWYIPYLAYIVSIVVIVAGTATNRVEDSDRQAHP